MNDWIEEIRQAISLAPRGLLFLVDHANFEKLGVLVRSLLRDHTDLEVVTNPTELPELPDASVVVYLPKAEHAAWLNINRPVFARKSLRVVLFCAREVAEVLAREAPDFYDWIAQRIDCPEGVAEHAVLGIRQALRCRAPGILFAYGDAYRNERSTRIQRFERVFREALPERTIRWIDPMIPYELLVRNIKAAGRSWVACDAPGYAHVERFRWALADAKRKTRAALLVPDFYDDRFWNISDHVWGQWDRLADDIDNALKLLKNAGATHPGRLLAASGLESSVVGGLLELLARGYSEADLLSSMLQSPDPGAGLAPMTLRAGSETFPVQGFFMTPPVQRYLGKRIALRRMFPGKHPKPIDGLILNHQITDGGFPFPLLRNRAPSIEFLLCQGERTPERWLELARLAFAHGDFDASAAWAFRSLDGRPSSEAYFVAGRAFAELGMLNWERGQVAGIQLRQMALDSLRAAEQSVDPNMPVEDLLALYALLAELDQEFKIADAGWEIERAAMLTNVPNARARDLRRVAEVLSKRGDPARAEAILTVALDKTKEFTEQAEIRLGLAGCSFAQKRFGEAEERAEALLSDIERGGRSTSEAIKLRIEELRVHLRLERGAYGEAVELADAMLAKASPSYWSIRPEGVDRIPLLAQALEGAGRAADAEALLKRLFNLPHPEDPSARFMGLKCREQLLSFVQTKEPKIRMEHPVTRRHLWNGLIISLQAQGRFAEANELQQSGPPKNDEDTTTQEHMA